MTNALKAAFKINTTSACITETGNTIIEIYDCYNCTPPEQRSYIKTKAEEPVHFTLHNPKRVNLTFAALDNCLLNSESISRCDFILGNFKKLYFVEIKQVSISNRRKARTEAIQQLHSAISFLRSKIGLRDTNLIAVVCLKAKQVYPLQNATRANDAVLFKETYNALLMEGQRDTF